MPHPGTLTANETILTALDKANPQYLADLLQKVGLGTILQALLNPVEETITISSAATLVLSASSVSKKAALMIQSIDVVTGTAAGTRVIGPVGADLSTTECTLSLDGDTITFEAVVTVVKIRWIPKPAEPVWTQDFPTTGVA